MLLKIEVDEKLLARAMEVSNTEETSSVIDQALALLIQHHAAKAIIALGGSQPDFRIPPRRRWSEDGLTWEGNPE